MNRPARIEPRFSRVASAIGDATRARILGVLLGGQALPAGEIADAVQVSRSTASEHLSLLSREGLIAAETRGRYHYFHISDADVVSALEALSVVAQRTNTADRWLREPYRRMKYARTCYRHLAGELGVRLLDTLLERGCLSAAKGGYELTRLGQAWLADNLKMEPPPRLRRERYAFPCLDWSERRTHLAGALATSLLEHFLARRWLSREPGARALRMTPQGKRALSPLVLP
jgi:DNA-binding transcriptional ArsR family regulator